MSDSCKQELYPGAMNNLFNSYLQRTAQIPYLFEFLAHNEPPQFSLYDSKSFTALAA